MVDAPWVVGIQATQSGWWFGFFFLIFHNIWDNPSHWLIVFKMVETTNQQLWLIYHHHPFEWGVSKGAFKKCNNFDPCVFFPDGEGDMYLRPPLPVRQKPCPGRFTFREGGLKVRKRYVTPYPPPNPPRTPRIGGGGGTQKLLNVRKQFVNCLWCVFVGM